MKSGSNQTKPNQKAIWSLSLAFMCGTFSIISSLMFLVELFLTKPLLGPCLVGTVMYLVVALYFPNNCDYVL